MTDSNPAANLLRELLLAVVMILILILGLWTHTGTMPPLVVVESSSMIHEESGEVGSIDAGDLILVMDTPYSNIVTFAEASNPNGVNYGYEMHGMYGDVIIYQKNGDPGLFTGRFYVLKHLKPTLQTEMLTLVRITLNIVPKGEPMTR